MKALLNCLDIENRNGIEIFSANVEGITFLKAQFLSKAKEFFYLRKGEDVNAHLIAAIYGHSLGFNWNQIIDKETREDAIMLVNIAKNKPWLSQIDLDRQKPVSDYRIICISEDDTERGKKINNYLGVSVMFIPPEKRHLYRLYVNDSSFAFFYRNGEGDFAKFYGYIGENDPKMVKHWKDAFIEEWETWKQLKEIKK